MAIYVMHILATAGARILINRFNPETPAIIHLLAGTFLGLFAPYVIYLIIKNFKWMPVFGFGRNQT